MYPMNITHSLKSLLHPNVLLLGVAMLAGTSGAWFARIYLEGRARTTDEQLSRRFQPRNVVVAGRDIQAGESIETEALAIRSIPRDFVPGGVVSAEQVSSLVGRRSVLQLRRGDPLVISNLRPPSSSLSALVGPGQRALTLSVDEVNAHAGLLKAGDYVDLYYSTNGNAGRATLILLLDRVSVLATGTTLPQSKTSRISAAREGESFQSITLLMTADDAARVVLAERTGTVTVVLRSGEDATPTYLKTRSSQDLQRAPGSRQRASGESGEQVELLLGGSGGITPRRVFLQVGSLPSVAQGRVP
jgi:pilus assembly protein CpaB